MTMIRSTPSAANLLTQGAQYFFPAFELWVEAVRRQRIRRSYGRLSDTQLRDIGLTPYELEVALSLSLERDAGRAIARAAAEEAARW